MPPRMGTLDGIYLDEALILMKEMAEASQVVEDVATKPGMKDPFGFDWKWLYRIQDANKKFKEWK